MAGENCKAMPFSLILVLSIHVSREEGLAHLMEAQAKAKGSKARLVGWAIGSRTTLSRGRPFPSTTLGLSDLPTIAAAFSLLWVGRGRGVQHCNASPVRH